MKPVLESRAIHPLRFFEPRGSRGRVASPPHQTIALLSLSDNAVRTGAVKAYERDVDRLRCRLRAPTPALSITGRLDPERVAKSPPRMNHSSKRHPGSSFLPKAMPDCDNPRASEANRPGSPHLVSWDLKHKDAPNRKNAPSSRHLRRLRFGLLVQGAGPPRENRTGPTAGGPGP